ncbi:MAG TPA: pitrilysin family protein [Myxococcales bacterium]|jgi:predicted Zn-dependent peptidase|nr:pitrilysin family protein [Myxococcales bacterium]
MQDPVHKTVLGNGLRVVTVELPHLHAGMLAAYVRAGSRHEPPRVNGVSHFLEHLFFRGSAGYPDGKALNAVVEDVGGNLNGVTTRDHGYYYTPIHPDRLDVPFAVLGDMLARPLFKEVELEREVILEEILDEVDEEGRDIDVDNLSKRALFEGHPLGQKIAGTRESVSGLREDDLRDHHARAYGARNLVLCAAGPLQHAQVVRLAEKSFGRIPAGSAVADAPLPKGPRGPRLVAVEHRESQTELRLSFLAAAEDHPDFPALLLLRRILDDGLAARLQLNVVERKGLAYAVHGSIDTFSDCSVFEVEAACAPRKAPLVLAELLRLFSELCDEDVPEEELRRAKVRHRIGLEFALDSAGEMIGWFGGTELFRPPEGFDERVAKLEAVTARDLRRVATTTFRRDALVACAVGPISAIEKRLSAAVDDAQGLPR